MMAVNVVLSSIYSSESSVISVYGVLDSHDFVRERVRNNAGTGYAKPQGSRQLE